MLVVWREVAVVQFEDGWWIFEQQHRGQFALDLAEVSAGHRCFDPIGVMRPWA